MKTALQPLRCLLVEDSEDDAKLVLRQLRASGYDVTAERVDTPEALRAALARAPWDLIISDFSMPQFSGLDALKILQASGHDLPFILVSGAIGEETAVAAMRAGAHDYLLKDKLGRLGPAVERELTNAAQRRARQLLEASLQMMQAGVENSADGVFWISADGRIREINQAGCQMIGYTREELLNTPVSQVDARWNLEAWSSQFAEIRQHSTLRFEYEQVHRDGRLIPVEVVANYLKIGEEELNCSVVRDLTARKHSEAVDAFLAQAGSSPSGETFFATLARFLAKNLRMDYICIDRLEGDALNATTLAVWHDGHFEDNLTYALKDTPCGQVVEQKVCCYPAHVVQSFPNDPALQELRAESYVGITLLSHTGQPIGLIAVIGRRPLANRALAEATLARVAPRAAGELERLAAEEALLQSEHAQRKLAEALARAQTVGGIGSWETDLATSQVTWSEQTHRIFETTAATFQPTHQAFVAFIHPDDRAAVDAAFIASAGVRTPSTIEHRIVMPDGRIKHVEERWETSFDENACPARAIGTCLDITERKQAELSLRTSEQRFKRFMDKIPGLAYIKDADGRTLFANKGFTDFLGLRLEDVVGKQSADFFPADFAKKVDAEDQEVLASGKTKELEEEFGDRIWMTRKFPIVGEGAAPMLAGITLDVTERRRAELALKVREEIFSSIVGQANDAIALIDAETNRFIEFNRAAHEGLGYTREEFAGFSIADIHAKHDTGRIRENTARIMNEGGRIFETSHVRKNGEVREVRISARPLQLHGRDYMAAVWSDITEAKLMEQKLQLSEARFRVLFEDISSVAIQGYRADGTTQFWNRASESLYGYTTREAIGRNLRDLIIPPEMQSGVAEAMRQMAEHATPIPAGELSLQRKDGSRIEVFSSHAIVQPLGRPAELFCMDVDLTSLKHAERILQQQTKELQARNDALARFNEVAVGRELRMIELKREVNELCVKLGAPPRFRIPTGVDPAAPEKGTPL